VEIAGAKVPLQRVSITLPPDVADVAGLTFVLRRWVGWRVWYSAKTSSSYRAGMGDSISTAALASEPRAHEGAHKAHYSSYGGLSCLSAQQHCLLARWSDCLC
jgi:hypothetical protein